MKNEFRNWSDLRVFLAVVREGSTLAASHKLGMTQPTVARRIEALEQELGLVLFDRDTRGFRPTQNAIELIQKAEAVEAATKSFHLAANELSIAKPIRITAYSENFSSRMIDIVNEFSAQNPDIAFEFLPAVQSLDLNAGEADIALRLIRTPPDPDLISRKISDARWTLYGGKSYQRQHGLPASPSEFEGHQFVTYQRGDIPNALHEWLLDHVKPEQIVATYTELELMRAAIRSGQGLGISNVKLLEDDEEYIACFDQIDELTTPHMMLISKEAYRRKEVNAFVKFFAPRYAAIFK